MTMNLLAIEGWLRSKRTNLILVYVNNSSQYIKVRKKNLFILIIIKELQNE